MKHILLTKFAVKFPDDNPRKRFEQMDDWIDKRMALFNKYCLPSVQAQTFKEFDWWFVISPGFRNVDKVVPELEKYGRILWLEADWKDGQKEVGPALEPFYKNQGMICTTRFDSDDMIFNEFMSRLSLTAKHQVHRCWLSFFRGYYFVPRKNLAILSEVVPNPFISFVENSDEEIKSVFWVDPHIRIIKNAIRNNQPIIDIGLGTPGWVHVFHDINIKYRAEGSIGPWPEIGRGPADQLLKDFVYK